MSDRNDDDGDGDHEPPYYRPEDYFWSTCGQIFMEIEDAIDAIVRRYQRALET